MGYTLIHGGLLRGILEGGGGENEKSKAQNRIFRPNNYGYGVWVI